MNKIIEIGYDKYQYYLNKRYNNESKTYIFIDGHWILIDGEYYFTDYEQNLIRSTIQKNIKKDQKRYKILDLGCGSGRSIKILRDIFRNYSIFEYTGIDFNCDALKSARTLAKKEISNSEIINEDIFRANLNQMYNCILMQKILYYFSPKDIQVLIKKYSKNLKKHGGFILVEMEFDIKNFYIKNRKKQYFKLSNRYYKPDFFINLINIYFENKIKCALVYCDPKQQLKVDFEKNIELLDTSIKYIFREYRNYYVKLEIS